MNEILSEDAKSFKILRPIIGKKQRKPMVTYTKKLMNCIYLNLARSQDELVKGLYYLFGPNGIRKSFKRLYFPKRFIWTSTLYVKPRVQEMINEKATGDNFKRLCPDFNGMYKNRIIDKRNLIVDFTQIFDLVIPDDPSIMVRSSVMEYIENVWPELLCYVLLHNEKHDKNNDIETSDESLIEKPEDSQNYIKSLGELLMEHDKELNGDTEIIRKRILIKNGEQPGVGDNFSVEDFLRNRDSSIDSDIGEMSDEEWKYVIDVLNRSLEAFEEKLLGKTQVFAMGGPVFGLSAAGFNKFIVSIPYTLKSNVFVTLPYIQNKMPIPRNIKRNPSIIYQINFMQFLYKIYEGYFNGHSNNQFINEIIKYDFSFHIYSESGVGFVMNMREIVNYFKYKPDQVARLMMNRFKMLTMCNTGVINDQDLDNLEQESFDKEIDGYFTKTENIEDNTTNDAKNKLQKDLEPIINQDLKLKSIIKAKNSQDENVEIIDSSNNENIDDKISHMFLSKNATADSKKAIDVLVNLQNTFSSKTTTKIISDNTNEAENVTLTSSDYDEILNTNNETSEDEDITEYDENEGYVGEQASQNADTSELDFDVPNGSIDDATVFEEEYEFQDDDNVETDEEEPEYVELKPTKKGPIKLNSVATKKVVRTPAEEKRINLLKEKYKSIKIDGKTIEEIVGNSSKTDIEIKDSQIDEKSSDPTIGNFNFDSFQKSYVKNNYQSDIINAVRSLSMNKETPLYITDVKIEDVSNQMNEKYTYTFKLEDENKRKHTLKFDIPKLNENGITKMNGNNVFLKKQLIKKPIVKIAPNKVYVTTELNSYQIMRTGVLLNKGSEVIRKLFNEYLTNYENVKVERGNCEEDNKNYLTTLEYDILAKNYFFVKINDENSKFGEHVEIFFSQSAIRENIEKHHINTGFENNIIPDNVLPIAINYTRNILYSIDMNKNSSVNSTILSIINELFKSEELLDYVKKIKTPKRRICTKIEVQSFTVPLVVFLNYLFGWDKVSSYFKENEIEFSEKQILNTHKLSIKFYDGYLYYNPYPINGTLLINGLTELDTENYKYEDLNNQSLYIEYAYHRFKTRNVAKGWVTAKENMLDLKTLQVLEALGLPTDFLEIFLYCNDLLVDNQVKSESDISNYRIRSNEIISECLYKTLNKYYMVFKKKTGKKQTMSIPQNAVMSAVYATNILDNYDAISPVGEMRALSQVTFKGPGGTNLEQALTLKKRSFDPSFVGTFSVSTPDNSNAGAVKELTIDCNITNTLGFIGEPINNKNDMNLTKVSSIGEAVVPFANKVDDPTRISYASTQNAHVGGLINSSLPPVRTGIEKNIKYHTSGRFVRRAIDDGVVTDIDEVGKRIFITYKTGKKEVIDYNNVMMKNSDSFNQASYECFVKVNEKVKKNQILAADSRFFKYDPLTKEVVYTQAINGMFGICEGSYTEDDADLITATFADKLKMDFTKRKQISIKPMDTLISYKKIGEKVALGDPLIVFDEHGTFEEEQDDDDDSLFKLLTENLDPNVVSQMIHQTPKSPLTGTITDIKVYWTVPVKQMSKSIAKFVNEYCTKIKKEIIEEESFTGEKSNKRQLVEVTTLDNLITGRINGVEVNNDGGIVIEYYISNDDTMSTGDKIALNSSLKSIDSYVVEKNLEPYTESGQKLDGLFSLISINARMVNSIWYNGWIGKILYTISKRWAKNFLQEIGEPIPTNERDVKIE